MFIEVLEVHSLKQHVGKLGVRDSLFRVFEARTDIFTGYQVVDGEIFSDIVEDIEECDFTEPVIIIEEQCGIFSAVEVEKLSKLFLHALNVVHDRFKSD